MPRPFWPATQGKLVGTIGDIGCFSLQQGKHITTGEGGLVVTNNADYARRMFLFINKAWGYGDPQPDHYFLALNYRMTELQGAVAVAQLDKLAGVGRAADRAGRGADGGAWPACRASRRRTCGRATCTPTGSTACASIRGWFPAGRCSLAAALKQRGIFSAPRYIQKPAFACEVFREQRTFGNSRWPFTLARPEAVDYRPERFPGTYAGPRRDPRAALERALHERARGLHRRVDRRAAWPSCGGPPHERPKMRFGPDRRRRQSPRPTPRRWRNRRRRAGRRGRRAGRGRAGAGRAAGLPGVSHRTRNCCERRECDAAIVCTPPVTHPEICCWLLDRGVHVLCEKPLAIGPAAARAMIAAAERSAAHAHDGVEVPLRRRRRRGQVDRRLRLIGEVVLFENAFTSRVDMTNRWNSDPTISGGGVLIDNGTHSVDIMRYFLGPLAEMQVVEGRRVQDIPVEDTVRVFVRSASGVMGSIDLSWSLNKELPHYISVYGSAGTLHVGWKESKFRRAATPSGPCSAAATTRSRRSAARSTTSCARSAGRSRR